MYWTTGSGRIELNITKKQAATGCHQGECDSDVNNLMQSPTIKKQLAQLNATDLKNTLREYGVWDETELSNHQDNLMRVLWLACGDINERY